MTTFRPSHLVFWSMLVLSASACTEFPSAPERTFIATPPASAAWPTSLSVGDTDTLTIADGASGGGEVTGLQLSWSSSDESVLRVRELRPPVGSSRVDSLKTQLKAEVVALARGTATITVSVEQPGFAPPDSVPFNRPITVTERWLAVSAGTGQSCAISFARALYCWGGSPTLVPLAGLVRQPPVSPGREILSVGLEGTEFQNSPGPFACILVATGQPLCWGSNVWGNLGIGSTSARGLPTAVAAIGSFNSISAGGAFTCGLLDDGRAFCWGKHTSGQLGVGRGPQNWGLGGEFTPPPKCSVNAVFGCVDFDTCQGFSGLADCQIEPILLGGSVEVGLETRCVREGSEFRDPCLSLVSVDAGQSHACGITTDGTAYCWGRNETGELGATSGSKRCELGITVFKIFDCSPAAIRVETELRFSQVAAGGGLGFFFAYIGGGHTCAVTTDGDLYCWGLNHTRQLGQSATSEACTYQIADVEDAVVPCSRSPLRVSLPGPVTAVAVGNSHSCALVSEGDVYCWGANEFNQLGVDFASETCLVPGFAGSLAPSLVVDCSPVPVRVPGGLKFARISAGSFHTCGITDPAGAIYCWGRGREGQLGYGENENSSTPVRLLEPTD